VAVPHLEGVSDAIVSFGQGCEGEPLLQGETIAKAVAEIRKLTTSGTINLNTNASLPDEVEKICIAGLDSIRISLSSAREEYYKKYFRNKKYSFSDVMKSIEIARKYNLVISLNLFVFPGITDNPDEITALKSIIEEFEIDLIQMRNLSIDPDVYLSALDHPAEAGIGMFKMIDTLNKDYPDLKFGYFNKPKTQFLRQ